MKTAAREVMDTKYLPEEARRGLQNRLRRVEGQIAAIRKAVEEGACVDGLLIQLSAARGAISQVGVTLAQEHLVACARTCMGRDVEEVYRRIARALAMAFETSR